MKRSTFIRIGSASAAGLILPLPSFAGRLREAPGKDDLATLFAHPTQDAKPYTWWHWMNGNITRDGITRDLEFMKKAGIGGFQLFQVGSGIPKGDVDFGGDQWLSLLRHTAAESRRLGLEFDMMNCGGWSSSGGPWITPELGMQQMTWSETHVRGGSHLELKLPRPYTKLGFYRDAFVLAFPSPGDAAPLEAAAITLTASAGQPGGQLLEAGIWDKPLNLKPAGTDKDSWLTAELPAPYPLRSIMAYVRGTGDHFTVEGSRDGSTYETLSTPPFPRWRSHSIEVPAAIDLPGNTYRFYRLRFPGKATVFQLRLSAAACTKDWPMKANFTNRIQVSAGEMMPPTTGIPHTSVIDTDKVVNLTDHLNAEGELFWDAPEGHWTILRIGHTAVGIGNHPAPDGGGGLECDKFSRKAYDYHFDQFFGKILPELEALGADGMSGAVIDSYEVGMQTWTEDFPAEFKTRRGYAFTRYLPALVGYVVGSADISDRFLWDIRRTEADMMTDNYFGRFAELCHTHGMKAYAEPYNGGPFDEFQSGARMDVPMGEFWAGMGKSNGVYYSIKLASAIAHIYGKKIVAAESYTGIPSQTKWQMHPYALKGQGDWMYTLGLNKFIFHVYAMQPHPTARPGMTMGPWGWMHSRTNSWAGEEQDWLAYVARTQHMLQQGLTVSDLVYFTGEQLPGNTPVLPEQLTPAPPKGYYYELTDGPGILTRMKADADGIILPDGMRFRLLVLPESHTISLELIQKIRSLVRDGAALLGPPPASSAGLAGYQDGDKALRAVVKDLWSGLDGKTHKAKSFGKGMVFQGLPAGEALRQLGVAEDFTFTSRSGDAPVNYLHRRIGEADVYFIACRRRTAEELVCSFRISGRKPEIWDPQTAQIAEAPVYEQQGERTVVPLRLEPAGSLFVVFRTPGQAALQAVLKDGKPVYTVKPFPEPAPDRYRDVSDNFTISCQVKPESEIGLDAEGGWQSAPTSFVFYPPEGETLYGKGHAACGLCLGRNGLIVFERAGASLQRVLTARVAISGWSSLLLRYHQGAPAVYLNGTLVGSSPASGATVHPGLISPPDDATCYFHGEVAALQLTPGTALPATAGNRRPLPPAPPPCQIAANAERPLLLWENGHYQLTGPHTTTINENALPPAREIDGPWEVSFPAGLGAPPAITLQKLISLKDHPIDGVRYFSGTATYRKTVSIPRALLEKDLRLFLDLGWVESIARVEWNGKPVSTCWKVPYRTEITRFATEGDNTLVIRVTNGWPNRLIGDEQLPAENEYGAWRTGDRAEFSAQIKKLPDWYREGKPKPPGGRITFATWRHYDKNDPLLESGLLGPVCLRVARAISPGRTGILTLKSR